MHIDNKEGQSKYTFVPYVIKSMMRQKKLGLIFLLTGVFFGIIFFFRVFYKPKNLIQPTPLPTLTPSVIKTSPSLEAVDFYGWVLDFAKGATSSFSRKFAPPLLTESKEYEEITKEVIDKAKEIFPSPIPLPKISSYYLWEIAFWKKEIEGNVDETEPLPTEKPFIGYDQQFYALYLNEKGTIVFSITNFPPEEKESSFVLLKNGEKAPLYKTKILFGQKEETRLVFSVREMEGQKFYYTLSTFECSVEDLKEFADSLLE